MHSVVVIARMDGEALLLHCPSMDHLALLMDLDLDLATMMAMGWLLAILVVVPLMGLQMTGINISIAMPFLVPLLSHVVSLKIVTMPTLSGILAFHATGHIGSSLQTLY